MAGIVAETSRERASYVIKKMPLKLAFSYEHLYYLKQGYDCKVMSFEDSLEDLMRNI